MKFGIHVIVGSLAAALLLTPLAPAPAGAQSLPAAEAVAPMQPGYAVPRTPWGDPDLQGKWPGVEMVSVPVQRPAQFGERNVLTDEEVAERAARELAQKENFEREGAGGPTGAPGHWLEYGSTQRQASLVVDPPDGRQPPMTPDGKARASAAPRGTFGGGPLNSPLDFTFWERCLSRGALGSTMPILYNSGIDITQSPGHVAIRYEMVHDHRVIPLGDLPALSPAIRQYMGDARGRWEGDTLVVESTNFTEQLGVGVGGGASEAMRLTERFTRVSEDTIRYEATVDDPGTWAGPWTVAFPLKLTPDYGMYEYACHEGNYGLENSLRAARAAENEGN